MSASRSNHFIITAINVLLRTVGIRITEQLKIAVNNNVNNMSLTTVHNMFKQFYKTIENIAKSHYKTIKIM